MNARPRVNMADPSTWPLYPILPMNRGLGNLEPENLGFMVAGRGPVVYHASILDLVPGAPIGPQLPRFTSTEYENLDAVAQAGWKVD